MKTDIHPEYKTITFSCACGATFLAGSTIKGEFKTEICSNCHPFYTGKQKLIDSSGRVDKFMAKMKKAQAEKEKKVKKVDNEDAEDMAKETAETTEEEVATETAETVTEEVVEKKVVEKKAKKAPKKK